MLYSLLGPDETPLEAYRTGTYVLPNGRSRTDGTFAVNAGARALDAAGRSWPLEWRLRVPADRLDLELELESIVADQLVRGTVLPTFYEGAATATGSKPGICFVEESYG